MSSVCQISGCVGSISSCMGIKCTDGTCAAAASDCLPSITSEPCNMDDFCCPDPEDFCCSFPRCCEDEEECNDNAWEAAFDLFENYYDDDHDHDHDDFDDFYQFDDIGVILRESCYFDRPSNVEIGVEY